MNTEAPKAATRCTEQQLVSLINDGKHLPKWLRDFHDQKDVFKAIEDSWGRQEPPYDVNWVNAQCYVIDRFLRFMAFHGYTLRKTTRFGSRDIQETIDQCRKASADAFHRYIQANASLTLSGAAAVIHKNDEPE
jgi:hypothetical protein